MGGLAGREGDDMLGLEKADVEKAGGVVGVTLDEPQPVS